MIHVSVYRSAHARVPLARDDYASFAEFADELELMVREIPECPKDATREAQKEAMLAWAPHRLRDTCSPCPSEHPCRGGPHRLLANVIEVTALVLDVDAIKCSDRDAANDADEKEQDLTELRERARSVSPGGGLIYESPSSAPDSPRVRIVAPVSRVITPEECRASRIALAHALGLGPDAGHMGAIDAAKIFFAGRMHGTPERRVWRW